MKLFGNRRNASHIEARKHKLTGVQRGFLLLGIGFLVLFGALFAIYKDFVRPMDIKQPTLDSVETEQTFRPPTVIQTQTDEDGSEVEVEVPASHKEDFYNILIVGTDDDGFRTDTIMIARLDVKEHTVAILSVPRDTIVESQMNVPKINGVYGYAGRGEKGIQNLKSHLAKLLGFEVDGYALVDLEAFVELVDLVGGVEFDVPMRMYYSDPTQDLYIDLQPGLQKLDGEHAMQLVRFRKGYATQDLQRTKVQQAFLQALAKQCLKVSNISKIGEMAEIFKEYVTTDMTVGNIAYFGQELTKCDFEEMYTYTLEGEAVMLKGVSYYAVYLNKTLEVVNDYFNPYDAQINESNVTILTPEYVRYLQKSSEPEEEEETEDVTEEEPSEEELPEEFPEDILPGEELPFEELPEEGMTEELPEEPVEPIQPEDEWSDLPAEELWPEY